MTRLIAWSEAKKSFLFRTILFLPIAVLAGLVRVVYFGSFVME